MHKGKTPLRLWTVAFWLAMWQLAAMAMAAAYRHGGLLLASPLTALGRLGELAVTAAFWTAVGRSAAAILGGFLLSCALAVACAALAARCRAVRELLGPLVAVVPLFISALMVFPPVYLSVLEGIGRADRQLLEMAKVFRVPWGRRAAGIYLPAVLPSFRAAVSVSLGLCWKAGAAAEVIGLPAGTIGERLYTAKVYFETGDLFAWTAVIVAVSVGFEKLFLRAVDALAGKAGC